MVTVPILPDAELRPLMPPPEDRGFGALRTEKGNLPLKAVEVRARIIGLAAELTVRQTFTNTHPVPLEATYIFPLPDRAATTGFKFEVAGRVVDGVLKERGQARQEYAQAIQAGHRAAIAEEERPGTFTMRVGNLMPRESGTVQLTLSMPLLYSDGEATFRFPLVVAPRYIPGAALGGENVGDGTAQDTDATPDASRITPPVLLPGFPNPVRLALEVEVDPGGLPIGNLRSSLHAVSDTSLGLGRQLVRVQPGERLDRDFVLRFTLGEELVRSALAIRADKEGGGTFALTVVPPVSSGKNTRPRDVVFVLDRSGSMEGWKMVSARRAVSRMVDTLTDKDRFTVYAFDNAVEAPADFSGLNLVPASDRNRYRAVEFLSKVDARGGTEMEQPLSRAVDILNAGESGRDRVLVLATDGQVGNEDQILRSLQPRLAGMRIFTVGIDTAVNEGFLKRFAAVGGGAFELVESEDRLDAAMDKLHRRVGNPVLTQLKLEPTGMEVESGSVTPARLPDLFSGAPLVLGGRFTGRAGSLTLKAVDETGREWKVTLQPQDCDNPALAAQWARAHLRDLEDRYAVSPDDALEQRIVATSLRYGVMCRFTSFVAVDRAEVVNKGGHVHQQTQAVEAPQGWDMLAKDARSGPGSSGGAGHGGQSVNRSRSTLTGGYAPPSPSASAPSAAPGGMAPPPPAARPAAPAPMAQAAPSAMLDFADDESAMAAPAEEEVAELKKEAERQAPPPPRRAGAPAKKAKEAEESRAAYRKTESVVSKALSAAAGLLGGKGSGTSTPAKPTPPPAKPRSPALEEAKRDAPAGLDLSAFRARAKELLEKLPKAGEDRSAGLGSLIVKLGMLVDDLKSVGAPASELGPLQALLDTLTALRDSAASGAAPGPFEENAAKVLRAFAEGGGSPAEPEAGRKRGFWK